MIAFMNRLAGTASHDCATSSCLIPNGRRSGNIEPVGYGAEDAKDNGVFRFAAGRMGAARECDRAGDFRFVRHQVSPLDCSAAIQAFDRRARADVISPLLKRHGDISRDPAAIFSPRDRSRGSLRRCGR
jgi:hypothetical protein